MSVGLFSYNGIKCHALPERDEVVYSHAVLVVYDRSNIGKDEAVAMFMRSISTESDTDYPDGVIYTERLSATATRPRDSTGEFSAFDELVLKDDSTFVSLKNIVWTDTDLYRPDGTLYLAASAPIPVNPAPTLDPTALLMGWQVGNRIRGGA